MAANNEKLGVFEASSFMRQEAEKPFSPAWWAVTLAKKLAEQQSSSSVYSKLERYYQGKADLPYVPDPTKEAFYRFQKKSRTNFAGLIVDAVTDRLSLTGWATNQQQEGEDFDAEAWQRWVNAGMELAETELISTALRLGEAYAFTGKTARGKVKVTAESPLTMAVERDEDGEVIAAGKYVHDRLNGVSKFYVYLPGENYVFTTPMKKLSRNRQNEVTLRDSNIGSWELSEDSFKTGLDYVPVYVLENLEGKGEFEKHIDLLDRINEGILNRSTITATQAHRKMMLKQQLDQDGDPVLTQHDEEGNEYDFANLIPSSPGEVGVLPPGVDIWESAQSDLHGIISAIKSDIADLAAVTNTLVSYLLPGGENVSSTATDQGNEAFFFKVKDRQKRFRGPFEGILRTIYEIDGETPPGQVTATFASPMRQSLTQIGQAWSQMSGLPLASKLKHIMQLSPSEIEEVMQEATQERFESMMLSSGAIEELPVRRAEENTTE